MVKKPTANGGAGTDLKDGGGDFQGEHVLIQCFCAETWGSKSWGLERAVARGPRR